MRKLTIFFDFDGPIVDVSDRYYYTYITSLRDVQKEHSQNPDWQRKCSIQPMTKDQFWSMKQHKVPDAEIALRSGLCTESIHSFLSRVKTLVNQNHILHHDRLQPGIDSSLSMLHRSGAQLILVTLRCKEQATQFLHNHGLLSFFSRVYGTSDETLAYANAVNCKVDLLHQAWHDHLCFDGRPLQSWMVGDTEADIRAGQAVGIPTIAITSGVRSSSYLKKFNPTRMHDTVSTAVHELMLRSQASCVLSHDRSNVHSLLPSY